MLTRTVSMFVGSELSVNDSERHADRYLSANGRRLTLVIVVCDGASKLYALRAMLPQEGRDPRTNYANNLVSVRAFRLQAAFPMRKVFTAPEVILSSDLRSARATGRKCDYPCRTVNDAPLGLSHDLMGR